VATTVEQAFREFASNLEITDRQASLVAKRRANVVAVLKAKLSLHPEESKVIGSYDRYTLTRYLREGDVDVMVVLHYGKHKEWDTSNGTVTCLDRVRSILVEAYPNTVIRRDRNCITMQFGEFRLDVVPAFKNDAGYYRIPDSIRKQWVKTEPFEFAKGLLKINATMGKKLVPLIKMIKGWNRDKGWPIRSFHLECIMYYKYSPYTQGFNYPSMVKVFFQELLGYLAVPCYDPVMRDRVDTYLDNGAAKSNRQIAIEKAQTAARKSAEAYEDQEKYSPVISIGEWKALMGEFFPSYG
jgi:hypothetical protein